MAKQRKTSLRQLLDRLPSPSLHHEIALAYLGAVEKAIGDRDLEMAEANFYEARSHALNARQHLHGRGRAVSQKKQNELALSLNDFRAVLNRAKKKSLPFTYSRRRR